MKRVVLLLVAVMFIVVLVTSVTTRDNGLNVYQQIVMKNTQKRIAAATPNDPIGATLRYFDAVLRGDHNDAKRYLSANTSDIRISMQHKRLEEAMKMQLAFAELFGVEKEELVSFEPSNLTYTKTTTGQPTAQFDLKVVSRRLFQDEVDVMVSYWRITVVQENGQWRVLDPAYISSDIRIYPRTSW